MFCKKGMGKMSKLQIMIVVIITLIACAGVCYASGYLLNTKSGKYHYTTCRTIKNPNASHFVSVESPAAAEAQGYVACKVCFR